VNENGGTAELLRDFAESGDRHVSRHHGRARPRQWRLPGGRPLEQI
jgi:hypothetical protein